jgi:tetratricopeptide (TPR) repeat protein
MVHLKRYDDAVRYFNRASELEPDNDVPVLAAAAALVEARRPDEALAMLEKRLPKTKMPGPFLVATGELMLKAGRLQEGADQLKKALVAAPEHPTALYLLGRVAENEGRRDEAKRLYGESLARGGFDPDMLVRLARIRQQDGDRAAARDLYLKATRVDPRNLVAFNALALLVAQDASRLDEAASYAERALALAPDRPEVLDTWGWLEFRRGRADAAMPALARAAESLSKDATVQYHAGVASARLGRDTEARAFFERALRIDPRFPEVEDCRKELDKVTR